MRPTQEELLERFVYNPETGKLHYKISVGRNYAGLEAGHLGTFGYVVIGINKKIYKVHQVIWCMVYGYWPKQLDHINTIRNDNRIVNLRELNQSQNCLNRDSSCHKYKCYGVSFHKRIGKWRARIVVGSKHHDLGLYNTLELAIQARKRAESLYLK